MMARRLEQMLQDRAFERGKIGRAAPPRTRELDIDVVRDAAILDHQHAIGQCDGFRHVMGYQDAVKAWSCQTRSSSRCMEIRVSASSAPSGSSKASTRG